MTRVLEPPVWERYPLRTAELCAGYGGVEPLHRRQAPDVGVRDRPARVPCLAIQVPLLPEPGGHGAYRLDVRSRGGRSYGRNALPGPVTGRPPGRNGPRDPIRALVTHAPSSRGTESECRHLGKRRRSTHSTREPRDSGPRKSGLGPGRPRVRRGVGFCPSVRRRSPTPSGASLRPGLQAHCCRHSPRPPRRDQGNTAQVG